ncbi:MAG TPA: hypothetical protein VE377_18885 [Candidatus Dormibacteraeota bacterium]|nr:hypothetical protein [Candidatus Dormibacteraeota bacterium]
MLAANTLETVTFTLAGVVGLVLAGGVIGRVRSPTVWCDGAG